MRRLLPLLALLAVPAPAAALPRALGPADDVALSGDAAILLTEHGRQVTVTRAPLDGGATTALFSYRARPHRHPFAELAASDTRVALVLTLTSRRGNLDTSQAFAGPPGGPLTALGPAVGYSDTRHAIPEHVAVAGDAVILDESIGRLARPQRTVVDADGSRSRLELPTTISAEDFQGDLVGFGQRRRLESEEDPPTRLVLRDWRTGETLRDVVLESGIVNLDLRPDGDMVVKTDGGGIVTVGADGVPHRLQRTGGHPVWAGERVAAVSTYMPVGFQRLETIDPDGTRISTGIPSRAVTDLSATAGAVLWRANGCALTAPIGEPPATAFTGSGCPGSEVMVVQRRIPRLTRTIQVPVRCLSAVTGSCEGELRARGARPQRYVIPADSRAGVPVRLTRSGFTRLKAARFRIVHLRIHPDDAPGGREIFLLEDRGKRPGN